METLEITKGSDGSSETVSLKVERRAIIVGDSKTTFKITLTQALRAELIKALVAEL